MREHLKTIGLVALATVLVWVWAEAESVTTGDVSPRVEFVAVPDLAIRVTQRDWGGQATVRLRGPTSALDRAQRLLAAPVRLAPGAGGVPNAPGEHTIDLQGALASNPDLRRLGVTVDEVDPPTLQVTMEALKTVSLPLKPVLQWPGGQAVELDGEPTLSVSAVSIRGPARLLSQLGETAAAAAVVDGDSLAQLRDDAPQTVVARVVPPEALSGATTVSMTPDRVSMVIRLLSRTESWTVPSMPIWIAVPPTEGTKWSIELGEAFLKNVTISGPKDIIRGMRTRGEVPVAYVNLTSDDLERRVTSKRVEFSPVPSTVQFQAEQNTVPVRIAPRTDPPKAP